MDSRIKAVIFNEEEHTYTYNGKTLHGVTMAIGKLMGKSFPDTDTVRLATLYGSDVHKAVENYYNSGNKNLSSEGAKWVVEELTSFLPEIDRVIECEVMVSDFISTASKVDVVLHTKDGAYLFDIKTTSHFDRPYCSLQLSIYKTLFEKNYEENVLGMFVLSTKKKRLFKILEQDKKLVDKILEYNKSI